jgi:hypothetical protein
LLWVAEKRKIWSMGQGKFIRKEGLYVNRIENGMFGEVL